MVMKLTRNKKGQYVFFGFMMAIILIIVAVIFIPTINDFIQDIRDPTGLDCSNSGISVGTKMTCVLVDLWPFYLLGALISASIVFITRKTITPIG